jgi:hypothetical protein
MKKMIHTAVLASVAAVSFAVTPAMADGYYGARSDTYRPGDYDRGNGYDRGYDNRRYDRNDRPNYARNYQNCRHNSGTTGLILGAGAGALAGRAIDKSGTCDGRR